MSYPEKHVQITNDNDRDDHDARWLDATSSIGKFKLETHCNDLYDGADATKIPMPQHDTSLLVLPLLPNTEAIHHFFSSVLASIHRQKKNQIRSKIDQFQSASNLTPTLSPSHSPSRRTRDAMECGADYDTD